MGTSNPHDYLNTTALLNEFLTASYLAERIAEIMKRPEVAVQLEDLVDPNQLVDLLEARRWNCYEAAEQEFDDYLAEKDKLKRLRPTEFGYNVWAVLSVLRQRLSARINGQSYGQLVVDQRANVHHAELDVDSSVKDRYLYPLVTSTIEHIREMSILSSLKWTSDANALNRLLPKYFSLQTGLSRLIDSTIRSKSTASIGIAGTRGIGKSTVIDWFCPTTKRDSGLVTVRVDAPVLFEPREFFLNLFTLLCGAIIGDGEEDRPATRSTDVRRNDGKDRTARIRLRTRVSALVAILCLSTSGYLAILLAGRHVAVLQAHQELALQLYVAGVAAIAILIAAVRVYVLQKQYYRRTLTFSIQRKYLSIWLALFGAAIIGLMIIAVQTSGTVKEFPGPDFPAIAILLSISLLGVIARFSFRWHRAQQSRRVPDEGLEVDLLGTLALRYRREIEYQQSYSTAIGQKVSSSGVVGLELSHQHQTSASRLPWSLPETVRILRSYIAQVSSSRRVVIGIDELDKIASAESAVAFIDSIKALFGVPGSFFLVSVSEEAVANFERRGLNFRDSFDSAFDQIERVPFNTAEQTIEMLRLRVVSIPHIFACLCHSLGNGIPREVIRIAQVMYEMARTEGNRSRGGLDLRGAAEGLALNELNRVVPALRMTISDLGGICHAEDVLRCTAIFPMTGYSLTGLCDCVSKLNQLKTLCLQDPEIDSASRTKLIRRMCEIIGLLQFMITVVDYCNSLAQGQAQLPSATLSTWNQFASIRHEIAINPVIASDKLVVLRRAHGLSDFAPMG